MFKLRRCQKNHKGEALKWGQYFEFSNDGRHVQVERGPVVGVLVVAGWGTGGVLHRMFVVGIGRKVSSSIMRRGVTRVHTVGRGRAIVRSVAMNQAHNLFKHPSTIVVIISLGSGTTFSILVQDQARASVTRGTRRTFSVRDTSVTRVRCWPLG